MKTDIICYLLFWMIMDTYPISVSDCGSPTLFLNPRYVVCNIIVSENLNEKMEHYWDGSWNRVGSLGVAARLQIYHGNRSGYFCFSYCCTWQSHGTLIRALTTCPTMPSCIRADYPCSTVTASRGLFLIRLF